VKNQDFNKLEPSEAFIGFNYCLDNSNRLFRSAEAVSKKGFYGIANSLLILSAEEGIKAILFSLKFTQPEKKYKVEHIFSDHVKKHNFSKGIFGTWKHASIAVDEIKADLKKEFPKLRKFPPELLKQRYDSKVSAFSSAEDISHEKTDKKWWNMANQMKNKGFYVDYINGDWVLPTVSKAEYRKSYMYVVRLVLPLLEFNDEINKQGKKQKKKSKRI
jgi:AbiV family abortive infection protein